MVYSEGYQHESRHTRRVLISRAIHHESPVIHALFALLYDYLPYFSAKIAILDVLFE